MSNSIVYTIVLQAELDLYCTKHPLCVYVLGSTVKLRDTFYYNYGLGCHV